MAGITFTINELSLDALTTEIKRVMRRSAKDAVQLGYMLRRVLEERLYADEYNDFDTYLEKELQMDYTMASRFIGINKKYSLMGNSMDIAEKYEQYSQGLLIEMLNMTPEQEMKITPDMTIKQAREVKKQTRIPKAEPEVILEGEFREIPKSEEVATSQPDQDLSRLKKLLDGKNRELEECMKVTQSEPLPEEYLYERRTIVGALANMVCELEELQEAPEPELQPELPILKNNDQRSAWLAKYKDWGLWYRDEHIDVNYYKYDFADGSRLVVAEYPQRNQYWSNTRNDEKYYHLLEKGKKTYGGKTYDESYRHQMDSETYLVEFLKNLQKKKSGK